MIAAHALLICLIAPIAVLAQTQAVKYYNHFGQEVAKEQAYYLAIGTIPTGKTHFTGKVLERFVSNKKVKAKKTYDKTGLPIGVCTEFFENGQMKEKYQLKNGYVFGGYVSWYPNGQKESEREYTAYSSSADLNYVTYNYWDSLGNQLVTDGMGHLTEYHNDYSIAAQGKIYKTKRSGLWKGYYPNGHLHYTEKYKNGELVQGNSILLDSTKFAYSQINTLPSPMIGFAKYYAKLTKAIKYPKSAKKIGLQGTVHIAYTIDASGQVTDHHILRNLSPDCDQEALRIFREVEVVWKAGTTRGNPKPFTLALPVSFKL